jgi:hypothetical protein
MPTFTVRILASPRLAGVSDRVQSTNMSVMAYDTGRRYPRHTDLSFPGYYYQGRDIPMDLSHGARADPRGYHLGDLVGGPRGQLEMERNEPTIDNGASRRRIAIAVSALSGSSPKLHGLGPRTPSKSAVRRTLLILNAVREVP